MTDFAAEVLWINPPLRQIVDRWLLRTSVSQDEIAMVTAECQFDAHIKWDEDEGARVEASLETHEGSQSKSDV